MLVQPSPEYPFLSRCGRSANAPAPEQDQRRDDRVGVLLCRTRRRGHGGSTWQDPRGSECRTRHRRRLPDLLVANSEAGVVAMLSVVVTGQPRVARFHESRARGAGLRRPDPETRRVREQGSARLAAEPCFARRAGQSAARPNERRRMVALVANTRSAASCRRDLLRCWRVHCGRCIVIVVARAWDARSAAEQRRETAGWPDVLSRRLLAVERGGGQADQESRRTSRLRALGSGLVEPGAILAIAGAESCCR